MVASPEICRLNGAKSKGAVTARGKLISSRNATKHGLLAKQPPLLVTEDLATFEGLVQGLVDHYQPANPVEHFLVQQVAMGMLKQYRLWDVEAAIANVKILKQQYQVEYPDRVTPRFKTDDWDSLFRDHTTRKEILAKEQSVLTELILDIEYDSQAFEAQTPAETLQALQSSLLDNRYEDEDRQAAVWKYVDEFDEWLCEPCSRSMTKAMKSDAALSRAQQLLTLAKQRGAEIDQQLQAIAALERDIQQAEIRQEAVPEPELFSRYQRQISRDLSEALDRLEAMQERKNAGSMGSFGHSQVN